MYSSKRFQLHIRGLLGLDGQRKMGNPGGQGLQHVPGSKHQTVSEYIIVFPEREYVERCFSKNRKYGASDIFDWNEIFRLRILDLEINLKEKFEKE